jgi:hypothetical protein
LICFRDTSSDSVQLRVVDAATCSTRRAARRIGSGASGLFMRCHRTPVMRRGRPREFCMEPQGDPALASSTLVRPDIHRRSKPIIAHLLQELPRKREAGFGPDHGVNPATWAQSGPPSLVKPMLDFRGRKRLAAAEAATQFARKHNGAVATGLLVGPLKCGAVVPGSAHLSSLAERPGSGTPGLWCSILNEDRIPALPGAGLLGGQLIQRIL